MTTFERHIFFRLLGGFLFLLLVLIVFFVLLHYVEYIDDFLDLGASFREVFLVYYPNYIPEIIKLVSPLALFLTCIYLTSKLAQELQITALMAAGVSLYRLLIPYLLTGILITGLMFWFNGWIVPQTNRTRIHFEMQYLKDAPRKMETSNLILQNKPGSLLLLSYFDPEQKIGYRISLLKLTSTHHRVEQRIDAARMQWIDSLQHWRFYENVWRTFTSDTFEIRQTLPVLDTTLLLLPRDLARTERDIDLLTLPDAYKYIQTLKRTGISQRGRQEVGYYNKFAYPFANLILLLIAIPIAATRRRGGQAVQLGIGLLIAFIYLAISKLMEPLGYAGEIPPAFTVWFPHFLFLLMALWLLYRQSH